MLPKLVIGCGYLGKRVAAAWLSADARVAALTRSEARAASLKASGIDPIVGDILRPETLTLPPAETLLIAVGYDRTSAATQYETYVDGLRNVLAAVPSAHRVIYISSTGVYGQTDDAWVDEASICEPAREGGRACLDAERWLLESRLADRCVILRLAGIYGPDRVPNVRNAEARLRLNLPGYLNLIHVDDAVATVLAAEGDLSCPVTFLVADGSPVLRSDYYQEVVKLFPPPAEPAGTDPSPGAMRRMGSKRVSNLRMREQLRVKLRYPTYREGLVAIAAGC